MISLKKRRISLSDIFTLSVTGIVLITSIITMMLFANVYRNAIEKNAVTSSEQAVVQVQNTLEQYTGDMELVMNTLRSNVKEDQKPRDEFMTNLLEVRSDVVAVMTYEEGGKLLQCWSGGQQLKEPYFENLSYADMDEKNRSLNITKPHVQSLFVDYYPWVVTISQSMEDAEGNNIQVAMDIRFSNIANYVDDVGIGQRGYCYIANEKGNIIYHPQQQLINSGLKKESTKGLMEGTYTKSDVIYTVYPLSNNDWKIVGVCFADEVITSKVEKVVGALILILGLVLVSTFIAGWIFSSSFSRPAKTLTDAMGEFERNAEGFRFGMINGTSEITALSNSFGHMVVRIQRLMEKVREEEISLRKTELKALQAQINPHFLYNTLDAIAWLCEDGRNKDAEEMVNALAQLFRISISKGYELIPIEKEMQHAHSYLKIQTFRYKNQFTYSFEAEAECRQYLCNKITLQPIIENAIYHGINRMVDEGCIKIKIYQEADNIIFSVEDNGVGMSPEECREILYREAGDKTGIGIKNVNDRIKIYFGDEYGITIDSELDIGTRVSIKMPKIKEDIR